MIETWIVPAQRLRKMHSGEEATVLLIRDLKDSKLECIHPDAMHRLFIIASNFAAHPEPTLWDPHHRGFDGPDLGRWVIAMAYQSTPLPANGLGRSLSRATPQHKEKPILF